ncbi:TPA: hypothetical protein ACYEKW_004764 [Escherichia coli]
MIIPGNAAVIIGSLKGNEHQPEISFVTANGRPFGTAFVISADKMSFVTYTIDITIPADAGGQGTVTATVNGMFVSGVRDAAIASEGTTGNVRYREVISFWVPPGGSVSLGRNLDSGVTVALAGGQEVIFL